jgi:LPS-assembly lipoprotein
VDFALRDLTTGQIVTSGTVENFTGYSATGTTVATLASAQDAQERLMRILAEQIIARLYAAQIPA